MRRFSAEKPVVSDHGLMKQTYILLAGLMVATALPAPLAAMPGAEAWEIGPMVRGRSYSVGMPANPRPAAKGALVFDFPLEGSGQIDAMTTTTGPLAGAQRITLRYRVEAAPRTRFIADENPAEPATVSLYFQQHNDPWSAKGRYGSYRWYAPSRAVVPLAPGIYTMTVRLDEMWTNVNGQPALNEPNGFYGALENTSRVGLAFGSASRRSHGVYTTGPARFTLLSFDIS